MARPLLRAVTARVGMRARKLMVGPSCQRSVSMVSPGKTGAVKRAWMELMRCGPPAARARA